MLYVLAPGGYLGVKSQHLLVREIFKIVCKELNAGLVVDIDKFILEEKRAHNNDILTKIDITIVSKRKT
jgi:hypothetical protein